MFNLELMHIHEEIKLQDALKKEGMISERGKKPDKLIRGTSQYSPSGGGGAYV